MKKRFLLHKDREKKETADANLTHLQVAPTDIRPKLAKELNFSLPPASLIILCILTMTFFVERLTAQTSKPQFESFKHENLGNQYYTNSTLTQQYQQTPTQNYSMGGNAQDIINRQNRQAMQQMGYNPPVVPPSEPYLAHQFIINQYNQTQNKSHQQHQELLNILNEVNSENSSSRFDMSYYSSTDFLNKSQSFTDAFNTLNNMLIGKTPLSISKSFLTIENAYGNSYLTEKEYNDIINQSAKFIKQWLFENGLNPSKNEDLHYGIQKFMRDTLTITIKQPENNFGKTTTHFPFVYDYQDFKAVIDFQNYFITKCLATGTGQCNSLPATYLAIAEKLGATTYLSFAPQHSFIKYPDSKGVIHAYEPTSNWKISDKWYVEHMGINPSAIESGIYLDTLNKKMIVANCMIDLAFGFIKKYGVADGKFVNECINTAMQYYPQKNNITAYFLKGSLLARQLEYLLYSNEIKDIKDIGQVQGATELYQALLQNEAEIRKLGYQELPEAIYLEMMQYQEFRGKLQQNLDTKQKRNLFQYQ